MTSLILPWNRTEDYVVSGFYGPGGWTAWCISLVASWAPILREDYPHNLHLIACALYMNWAAMDFLRLPSLDNKLDGLAAKKELLKQGTLFGAQNETDTVIIQKHWPSDVDQPVLPSIFPIPGIEHVAMVHQVGKLRYTDGTDYSGLWDLYTMPTTNNLTSQLRIAESRFHNFTEILQRVEFSIEDQAHQLHAALSVINLGTLHSCVQLTVCTRKLLKVETAAPYRRRNFIIIMGLVLPSIIQLTDLLSYNLDFRGVFVRVVWITSIVLMASPALFRTSGLAHVLPSVGRLLMCILALIWVLVFVGWCVLAVRSTLCPFIEEADGPRFRWVPRTSSKITELDQAFALFAALLYFFYDFGTLFVRFLKCLRFRFEQLVFGAQPHHNTWAGIPLANLPR